MSFGNVCALFFWIELVKTHMDHRKISRIFTFYLFKYYVDLNVEDCHISLNCHSVDLRSLDAFIFLFFNTCLPLIQKVQKPFIEYVPVSNSCLHVLEFPPRYFLFGDVKEMTFIEYL